MVDQLHDKPVDTPLSLLISGQAMLTVAMKHGDLALVRRAKKIIADAQAALDREKTGRKP
jgi:hypothetical protein